VDTLIVTDEQKPLSTALFYIGLLNATRFGSTRPHFQARKIPKKVLYKLNNATSHHPYVTSSANCTTIPSVISQDNSLKNCVLSNIWDKLRRLKYRNKMIKREKTTWRWALWSVPHTNYCNSVIFSEVQTWLTVLTLHRPSHQDVTKITKFRDHGIHSAKSLTINLLEISVWDRRLFYGVCTVEKVKKFSFGKNLFTRDDV